MDREYGLTEDGLLLPPTANVLDSPDDFDRGPHGVYNEPTSQEFAEKMVRPTWYVLHDDAGESFSLLSGFHSVLELAVVLRLVVVAL
jgi:hypothetical protein